MNTDTDFIDSMASAAINQIENIHIGEEKNLNNQDNSSLENYDYANITYKRTKLVKLNQEEKKGIYSNEKIKKIYDEIFFNHTQINYYISHERLEFYYYNCEDVKDYGYGCAWRCIQTLIGTLKNIILYDKHLTNKNSNIKKNLDKIESFTNKFEHIFLKYGNKVCLEKLYLSCYSQEEIPLYLKEKEYAPHETQWGWAEPYLCKLIMHEFGINGDLYLINSYNPNAFTPAEVFNKTIDYEYFKNLLFEHFRKDHKLPVIIDDSVITICIVGIYANKDVIDSTTTLLIADPHVKVDGSGDSGIYHIVLDSKGNFDNNLNPHPNLCGKRMMFENGSWMVYMPNLIN